MRVLALRVGVTINVEASSGDKDEDSDESANEGMRTGSVL